MTSGPEKQPPDQETLRETPHEILILRSEELIQKFFDQTLDDSGARELLAIWERSPKCEQLAQDNFYTELAFRIARGKQADMTEGQVARLLELGIKHYGPKRGAVDPAIDAVNDDVLDRAYPSTDISSEDWLDFEQILKLASVSQSIPLITSIPESVQTYSSERIKAYDSQKDNTYVRRFMPALVLLLLCLFGISVYQEFSPSPKADLKLDVPFHSIARVDSLIDPVFSKESLVFKQGQELEEKTAIKLESGLMTLLFDNGVRVVLDGPVSYVVQTSMKNFCDSGTVSVEVPAAAIGFEVLTPTMNVCDLGTEFLVDVQNGLTDVHVITGEVQVSHMTSSPFLLSEGFAAKTNEQGNVRQTMADAIRYRSKALVDRLYAGYLQRRREQWDRLDERERSDPSLVYSLRPSETSLTKVSGSRNGNRAVLFRSERDYLDIDLQRQFTSMTLLASVRLDAMNHNTHTLLLGKGFIDEPGAFLWQIDRLGTMQFHINADGRNNILRYDSSPCIQRRDWRTWVLLGLTVDAQKSLLSFYVDGKLTSSVPLKENLDLQVVGATIGNRSPFERTTKRKGVRYFNGAMENFWIFSRCLSAQEMEEYRILSN